MKHQVPLLNLSLTRLLLMPLMLAMLSGQVNAQSGDDNQSKNGLKLVGEAELSVLFWDVYHSWLYTPSGRYNGIEPGLVFEIRYLRAISQQQLLDSTVEQWQHLKLPAEKYQLYVAQLRQMWPQIRKGDVLTLKVAAGYSEFFYNHQSVGVINNPEFAGVFLAIWLSPDTSEPKLRQQLLGGTNASD